MLYRIYTEDKNRESIEALVNQYFSGFTIIETTGYWEGTKEKSLIIEIITADHNGSTVRVLAEAIRSKNKQQSVLVTSTEIKQTFINNTGN